MTREWSTTAHTLTSRGLCLGRETTIAGDNFLCKPSSKFLISTKGAL